MKKKITAFILLILLGMIWGTGYSIARYAMTHDVPPLGYSFWQSIGPACLLFLISKIIKNPSQSFFFKKENYFYYFVCGLTGVVIPNSIMYFAAPHLPAGILAVVVNTVPIITYPLALFARTEKFNFSRLFSIVLAVIGLMLLVLPGNQLPTLHHTPWIFIVLFTPFSFAFCAVYIARFRPHHSDALTLSAGMLIASSLLLLPVVLLTHSFYLLHFPLTSSDWVILLEIILSSVGYILFFQLIKIAGPVYYSLVDTIVSITGLTWGYFLFHEKLTPSMSLGIVFILLALFLVNRRHYYVKNSVKNSFYP